MKDAMFCMPVEDVFHIRERGLVVTGRIEEGEVSIGDIVCFETADGKLIRDNITLDGINTFEKIVVADKGMNVGLFFQIPYIRNLDEGLKILPVKKGDFVKK